MANNKIQIKRTTVSGRTPNTTSSGNSQYITTGELALNLTDAKLFSSNGSTSFEVGSNLTNLSITNSITLSNDKNIYWRTVNTAATAAMKQQSDDNFVFYSTNTAYGQRAVWSIFANSDTSAFSVSVPTVFNANINLGQVALTANGSTGAAGQVLTTNGTSTYWSSVSGGSGSVNLNSQYVWTNTHTFQANISFTGNNISLVTNTGSILFAGSADQNWKIGRNTGSPSKFFYSNNTLDIIAAGSPLEGFVIGQPGANTYLETGYAGTFTRLPIYVGNTTQNVSTTNTSILLQANTTVNTTITTSQVQVSNSISTSNLTATGLQVGNSTVNSIITATTITVGNSSVNAIVNSSSINVATYYAGAINATSNGFLANSSTLLLGNTSVNVAINTSTLSIGGSIVANSTGANNAFNLGGTAASGYQTTAGLSANVATLTANNSNYLGGIAAASYVNSSQLSSNLSNYALLSGGLFTGTVNATAFTTTGNSNATNFNAGANLVINSTALTWTGNSTTSPTISFANTGSFTIGNSSTTQTTSIVTVANSVSNVQITPATIFLGNSTVNTSANTSSVNTATYYSGAINSTSTGFLSNSTVLMLGNSTVNTAHNTSAFYIGTTLIANTLGVYHTGTVNAASHTVGTVVVANTTTLNANGIVVNSSGGYFTGTVNATSFTAGTINATSSGFLANSTSMRVGNSSVNAVVTSSSIIINDTSASVLTVGNSTVNSIITPTTITVGNSTINTVVNTSSVNAITYLAGAINATSNGFLANSTILLIGNSSVNASINSTTFTGTANNSTYLGGTIASGYQTTAGLSANVATLTSNNASYLGGTAASGYQTTAGLSANVATLTANNSNNLGGVAAASYVNSSQLSSNLSNYALLSGGLFTGTVNATSFTAGATGTGTGGLVANSTVLFIGNNTVNATVNTTTLYIGGNIVANSTGANNAFNLGGVAAASYVNSSQLSSNLSNYALLSGALFTGSVNAASHTVGTSFVANTSRVRIDNTVGLEANGGLGSAGQVLTSNGTTVYWSTVSGGGGTGYTSNTKTVSSTASTLIDKFTNSTFVSVKYLCSVKDGSNAFKHFSEISAINQGVDVNQMVYGEVYTTSLGTFTLTKNADTTSVDLMFVATGANATNTYTVNTIRFDIG